MNTPRFEFGPREPAFNRWSIRDEKEDKENKKDTPEKAEIKPKEKTEKDQNKKTTKFKF